MNILTALLCIMLFMVIGEIVSTKTKAFVPSVFVTAALFLVGFWTFFPKDIVAISGLGKPFAYLSMYLLVVHMGSLMNVKQLLSQWRTVLISLSGICGILLILMTLGRVLLGKQIVLVGAPPLTGGLVAALLMQEAAASKGLEMLSVLAILVYVAQGFVGYPITAIFLKKEGAKLLKKLDDGTLDAVKNVDTSAKINGKNKKTLIPKLPEKYNTSYMVILKMSIVACLAFYAAKYLNAGLLAIGAGFSIHAFVVSLIFGVIFAEIGFLDRSALTKASSFGIAMISLMAFIFSGLQKATPDMLVKVAVPLFGVIFIGVIGLIIGGIVVGKVLGESIPMSISISMNALYGFPPNYILTEEAIKSLTNDEGKREKLTEIMMPKMLVGGFTSVTIASVIVSGIFASML